MPSYNVFLKEVSLNEWTVEGGGTALEAVNKEVAEPTAPGTTQFLKSTLNKKLVEAKLLLPTKMKNEMEVGSRPTAMSMHISASTVAEGKPILFGFHAGLGKVASEPTLTSVKAWYTVAIPKGTIESLTAKNLEEVSWFVEKIISKSTNLYAIYVSATIEGGAVENIEASGKTEVALAGRSGEGKLHASVLGAARFSTMARSAAILSTERSAVGGLRVGSVASSAEVVKAKTSTTMQLADHAAVAMKTTGKSATRVTFVTFGRPITTGQVSVGVGSRAILFATKAASAEKVSVAAKQPLLLADVSTGNLSVAGTTETLIPLSVSAAASGLGISVQAPSAISIAGQVGSREAAVTTTGGQTSVALGGGGFARPRALITQLGLVEPQAHGLVTH